ncbi:hypothetical protein [Fluviicola taffensis]|uniref:hypothetical protein n=1 Tax=Fluviicola taffensis TaxID=191579 RepID=UPI003137EC8B
MNKILTLSVILLTTISLSHAQFKGALKNVKDKASEKVDQVPASSTSSGSKSGGSLNGEPAYDPESPTYRAFSIVRDEISSTKHILKDDEWNKNVEGRNDEATRYLAKAKENLVKLQNDPIESKKPYVKDLAASWDEVEATRKEKFDAYTMNQDYSKKLDEFHRFAMNGWEISDKSLEASYTGYHNFKKEFETKRPEYVKDGYVQKRFMDIDNYFNVEVYKVIPALNAQVDGIISRAHAKNSSGDEDYLLNAKGYLKDFEEPIAEIAYNKQFLLENKTEINAVQAKLEKEKAFLDEYVNSGKCDAHRAKFHQAMVDAVRLAPKKMSNVKYEGMALAGVEKGKATRAVITSDVWLVKKNEWGLPLYKYLPVDIAVTVDGKCWLAYGQIRKTYEGGGQYGGEFFNYWGLQDEMNCANTMK